ncbi:MAG: glycosyltransferase, partial [Acidimicrobiales bacterium]
GNGVIQGTGVNQKPGIEQEVAISREAGIDQEPGIDEAVGISHETGIDQEIRDLIGPSESVPELTIVMPYYNPGQNLGRNVRDVLDVLERTDLDFEVIAVSDGTTDGSGSTIESIDMGRNVRRIELARHKGKGEALRVGLNQGRGRYLGFIDADGDLPASLLGRFVSEIRSGDVDVVLGSKRHLASDVEYPMVRRIYSWGFQQLVRILFDLEIRDTQTGIKVLRREVLESVLPLMMEQRYCFDLELLVLARDAGFDRFEEMPVRIERQFGSTISLKAVGGILADTFSVWWRWRVMKQYRSGNKRRSG